MPPRNQHVCLQGDTIRVDTLPLGDHPEESVRVEIYRPHPEGPTLARWRRGRDAPLEGAVADRILVTSDSGGFNWGSLTANLTKEAPDLASSIDVERISTSATYRLETPRETLRSEGPPRYALAALPQLKRHPAIRLAEPDFLYFAIPDHHAPERGDQGDPNNDTELNLIHAFDAWTDEVLTNRIRIAVLDSGVDLDHPYLQSNIATEGGQLVGFNAIDPSSLPEDDAGHGTACAGLIGASQESHIGVYPTAQLVPVKFLNEKECGLLTDAVAGIEYALEKGVRVISCSWGGPSRSDHLLEAIQKADRQGALIVAGAGNDGVDIDDPNTPFYPASFSGTPNLVTVGACSDTGAPLLSMNHGSQSVLLTAPGERLLSTQLVTNNYPHLYYPFTGTSVATALIAGVCGLVMAANPDMGHHAVRTRLIQAVRPLVGTRTQNSLSCCTQGFIDVHRAVRGRNLGRALHC